MPQWTWIVLLALAAACVAPALAARPFAANRSEILRTHAPRNPGARPPGSRRRARDAAFHTTPPPPPPLSGPYWANSSLVGVEVSCDEAAKSCLAIGRLLHEASGRCYPIGDSRPCKGTGYEWVLDANALREGTLRGVCRLNEPCSGRIMAYDGVCRNVTHIYTNLCPNRARLARHPTGRWECVCPKYLCPSDTQIVRQPTASGRCVLPNFQERDTTSYRVSCTQQDAQCLDAAKLPFQGGCVRPLSREACPEGQWLILDERAAAEGHLRASCAPERPCGARAQLLRTDGRCHAEEELRNVLCPNERLLCLPTGETACTMEVREFLVNGTEKGTCVVNFSALKTAVRVKRRLGLTCATDDNGICTPKVNGMASDLVIVSEDS